MPSDLKNEDGWQVIIALPDMKSVPAFEAVFSDVAGAVITAEDPQGPGWSLTAYFPEKQDIAALQTRVAIAAAGEGIAAPEIGFEPVPPQDWVAEYQRRTPPLTAGRFFVAPEHYSGDTPDGLIAIRLDPGRAFGTGEHGSTKGCLLALDRLCISGFRPACALDVGCGSALLAIAMAKLWPDAEIFACDNDPVAVQIGLENTEINRCAEQIAVLESDFYSAPAIAARAPFDLVAANILAGPLMATAAATAAMIAANGFLILSGILDSQADEVISVHAAAGMKEFDRLEQGEWSTVILCP
jgi:ribosomal protein L11 methyltransferase